MLLRTLVVCVGTWVGMTAVSGCAMGNSHTYHLATPLVRHHGSAAVAIAVHDQRAYVLKEDKTPDFVGLSRGGWGNSFDVDTESEKPLADDMTGVIARSLNAAGYRVTPVATDPKMTAPQLAQALSRTQAQRWLWIQMREWKSDTYSGTALIYDVTAQVLDAEQHVLGQATILGRDNLGSAFNAPGHAKKAVPPAYAAKLEMLLNDPKITQALELAPQPAPVAAPARTPNS